MSVLSIFVFEPDLIFSSKFNRLNQSMGIEFRIFSDSNEFLTSAQHEAKALIINLDAFSSENLQSAVKIGIPVMGYYSHVNSDVARNALRLGVSPVVTRGAFLVRSELLVDELLRATRKGL